MHTDYSGSTVECFDQIWIEQIWDQILRKLPHFIALQWIWWMTQKTAISFRMLSKMLFELQVREVIFDGSAENILILVELGENLPPKSVLRSDMPPTAISFSDQLNYMKCTGLQTWNCFSTENACSLCVLRLTLQWKTRTITEKISSNLLKPKTYSSVSVSSLWKKGGPTHRSDVLVGSKNWSTDFGVHVLLSDLCLYDWWIRKGLLTFRHIRLSVPFKKPAAKKIRQNYNSFWKVGHVRGYCCHYHRWEIPPFHFHTTLWRTRRNLL